MHPHCVSLKFVPRIRLFSMRNVFPASPLKNLLSAFDPFDILEPIRTSNSSGYVMNLFSSLIGVALSASKNIAVLYFAVIIPCFTAYPFPKFALFLFNTIFCIFCFCFRIISLVLSVHPSSMHIISYFFIALFFFRSVFVCWIVSLMFFSSL